MKIYPYQDLRGEWRWRLVAENGRIMADSAEGYATETNLERALIALHDGGIRVDVEWPQESTPT